MENFDIPKEYLGNYRKDTLSVIEAGMLCAVAQASKSNDPSTQVGACLIDESGNLISMNCIECTEGFYFIESTKNCYTNEYITDEKTVKLLRMFNFVDISKIK